MKLKNKLFDAENTNMEHFETIVFSIEPIGSNIKDFDFKVNLDEDDFGIESEGEL